MLAHTCVDAATCLATLSLFFAGLYEPKTPGCYYKTPSSCQQDNSFSATFYEVDSAHKQAEERKKSSDPEQACLARKSYWDRFCGVTDTEMFFKKSNQFFFSFCQSFNHGDLFQL